MDLFPQTEFSVLLLLIKLLQNLDHNKRKYGRKKISITTYSTIFSYYSPTSSVTFQMCSPSSDSLKRGITLYSWYNTPPPPQFVEKPFTILFSGIQRIYNLGSTMYIKPYFKSVQQSKVD